MYPFLVILKFLQGSSLDSILDKLNLFSVHLAHFEVFICKISIHCLIYFMVLNYSDYFIGLTLIIGNLNVLYETSKPNRHVFEQKTINGIRSLSNTVCGTEPPHQHKEHYSQIDREPQTLLLNKTVPSEVPAFILPLFFVQELVFLAYLC